MNYDILQFSITIEQAHIFLFEKIKLSRYEIDTIGTTNKGRKEGTLSPFLTSKRKKHAFFFPSMLGPQYENHMIFFFSFPNEKNQTF